MTITQESQYNNRVTFGHAIAIIAFGLILTFPSILLGFPAGGHDGLTHLTWSWQFSEQLWAGDLYPRWLMGEYGGLGGPTFYYYGPIPYYVTSFLRPIFVHDTYGWHQLAMSAFLALVASGFFTYLWMRSTTSPRTALFAAILYMLMPYHVAIDLYERAAFAEYWAFVWMPLCLFYVSRIRKNDKRAVLGLSMSYALLIMTHLPTTLIFSIVLVGYSIVNSTYKRNAFFSTIASMILGTGLAAFYLMPALAMQDYVLLKQSMQSLYEGSFLFSELMPTKIFRIELTLVVLGTVVVSIIGASVSRVNLSHDLQKERGFWIVIGIISVFMMTPLSIPVVRTIPTLYRIQFPWRYNAILVLAAVAIVALGWQAVERPYSFKIIGMLGVSSLLISGWMVITIWQGVQESTPPFYPRGITYKTRESLNPYFERGTFTGDYRPRWVHSNPFEWYETIPQVSIDKGVGNVEVTGWIPREITLMVDGRTDLSLTVGQLYWPAWEAVVTGMTCCDPPKPSGPKGLLNLLLPSGNYELILRFKTQPSESVGQFLSLASAAIFLLLASWLRFKKHVPSP